MPVGGDVPRWPLALCDQHFAPGLGHPQRLDVISTSATLAGKPVLAGKIPAGVFPRQLGLSPDGRTLYITNFLSEQLETISVPTLVRAAGRRPG
jgi:hypothetical protein